MKILPKRGISKMTLFSVSNHSNKTTIKTIKTFFEEGLESWKDCQKSARRFQNTVFSWFWQIGHFLWSLDQFFKFKRRIESDFQFFVHSKILDRFLEWILRFLFISWNLDSPFLVLDRFLIILGFLLPFGLSGIQFSLVSSRDLNRSIIVVPYHQCFQFSGRTRSWLVLYTFHVNVTSNQILDHAILPKDVCRAA